MEGAEGAVVEVLQAQYSTQAVDAQGTNSDELQQPEGCIDGSSDTVYPQCGGRSCCAVAFTGAVLVQPQLVDVPVVPVIGMVVHSLEARRLGGLAGAGGGLYLPSGRE